MNETKGAVFLDRDGTINVEKHYLYRIADFQFLTGSIEGMRLLCEAGFPLVIATNQSGIGRGYYTEADFHRLNDWMLEELKRYGISIAAVYYCPHLPDASVLPFRRECACRKPKTGMFLRAARELGVDLNRSYAIGDKLRDCAVCKQTDCRGFLVQHNEAPIVIAQIKNGQIPHVRYAENLLEAAKRIVKDTEVGKTL